jgi:hypothetical protein
LARHTLAQLRIDHNHERLSIHARGGAVGGKRPSAQGQSERSGLRPL